VQAARTPPAERQRANEEDAAVKLLATAKARRGRPGFTIPDVVVACSIMATLSMMAIPVFNTTMSNSKLDGAARQLMSDVREARSRAVTTGWRFRIVANDSTVTGTYRNQYRIEGKSSVGRHQQLDHLGGSLGRPQHPVS
jgi:Tfp pilus assembly protein FimT